MIVSDIKNTYYFLLDMLG